MNCTIYAVLPLDTALDVIDGNTSYIDEAEIFPDYESAQKCVNEYLRDNIMDDSAYTILAFDFNKAKSKTMKMNQCFDVDNF